MDAFGTTCANAISLNGFPLNNVPFSCGSTNDINMYNIPSSSCVAYGCALQSKETLLKWTAPYDMVLTLTVKNVKNTSIILLMDGCPTSGGNCLSSVYVNSSTSTNVSVINKVVTGGHTYYILIDERTCSNLTTPCSGTQTISMSGVTCSNNLSSLQFNQVQNLVCATSNQIGYANASSACVSSTGYLDGHEAMVTYTPSESGYVTVEGAGLQTFSAILVYDGCPLTESSCIGGVSSSDGGTKSVVVHLLAGETYYILVDVFPNPEISPCDLGTATIIVKSPPYSERGDNCVTAENLDRLPTHVVGTTLTSDGYSDDYTSYCGTPSGSSTDHFYYVDLPHLSRFVFEQVSNDFDSQIFFTYGYPCPGNVIAVCWNDPDIRSISWRNTTGSTQRMYVIVDGYGDNSEGNFEFNWSLEGACSAPTGLSSSATPSSITAMWSGVNGAQGYQLRGRLPSTNYKLFPVNGLINNTSRTITNDIIQPGRTFFWQVRAKCSDGTWSGWSAESSITIPAQRTVKGLTRVEEFVLMPNPTNGSFHVVLGAGDVRGILNIFDVNGHLVKQMNVDGDYTYVDCSELVVGVYMVQLQTDGGVLTQKLIKQR